MRRERHAMHLPPRLPGRAHSGRKVPQRQQPTQRALAEIHARPLLAGGGESDGEADASTAELGSEHQGRRPLPPPRSLPHPHPAIAHGVPEAATSPARRPIPTPPPPHNPPLPLCIPAPYGPLSLFELLSQQHERCISRLALAATPYSHGGAGYASGQGYGTQEKPAGKVSCTTASCLILCKY